MIWIQSVVKYLLPCYYCTFNIWQRLRVNFHRRIIIFWHFCHELLSRARPQALSLLVWNA